MKIKILKVGDRAGQIVADNGMLSRMVAAYDPRHHEAPLFVGAVAKDTEPAVGWVSSLFKEGDALYAECRQILDQVAKDLSEKRRHINKVGFYPNHGLRHISLTGAPISIPGRTSLFKGSAQYYEFQEGGVGMDLIDNTDQEVSSEADKINNELIKKMLDVLDNPPEFDQHGIKWGEALQPLSQLIDYVRHIHPELTKKLKEANLKEWFDRIRPILSSVRFCEAGSVGDILQRKTVEICLKQGCSFSESFSKACLENPVEAQLYYEEIRGK